MRHASLLGGAVVLVLVVAIGNGCGIRGYHWAGGTGDVTHAIEPGARVVFPNAKKEVPYAVQSYGSRVAVARTARFKGECDDSLWARVYNPKRLEIHGCYAVTGITVDATRGRAKDGCRHESDGDGHCFLKLAPGQEQFLNAKNLANEEGNLVFEPMCQYRVTQKDAMQVCKNWKQAITLPPVGSRVRITGVFVTDTQHGHNELHNAYSATDRWQRDSLLPVLADLH